MNFQLATRSAVRPLIAIFGESNSGKTMSALLLARGIAGPDGLIAMIDTESGRGSLYAGEIPGGYQVGDMEPPFSPQAYQDALDAAEQSKAACIVVDSFSHEWEGDGGVCDMAGDKEANSGKAGLNNWKEPKSQHQKLVLRLMRSKVPVIVCLRAKYKTKNQPQERNGRTIQVPVRDDFLTPIQSEGFLFEATIILEMSRENPGSFVLTKWSVPDILKCFPGSSPKELSKEKLGIKHGQAIAAWCASNAAPARQSEPVDPQLKAAKTALWTLVKGRFENPTKFQEYLIASKLISETKTLAGLTLPEVTAIFETLDKEMNGGVK